MLDLLKKPIPIGLFFVALALLVNEWTVAWAVSEDGSLELPNLVIVRAADTLALLIGGTLLLFRVNIPLGVIVFNVAFFGFLLLCVEGGLYFLVHSTSDPAAFLPSLKQEIYQNDKSLIQYFPDCAQHDDVLGYTLRPGNCTFAGAEFSNEYRINRLGLRDDDHSLEAPEIIVLGDSYAMGWGVDQEQSFAEQLADRIGKSVLNAAISSYGTARQILLLERLDTTRLETLVIQYCHNDYDENEAFVENGGRLAAMSARKYKRLVRENQSGRGYYLGRHLSTLLRARANKLRGILVGIVENAFALPRDAPPTADDEAGRFLKVLAHSGRISETTKIIVLELGPFALTDNAFIDALGRRRAAAPDALDVKTLRLAPLLRPEHFYPLDGHINAAGHEVVAAALLKELGAPKIEDGRQAAPDPPAGR